MTPGWPRGAVVLLTLLVAGSVVRSDPATLSADIPVPTERFQVSWALNNGSGIEHIMRKVAAPDSCTLSTEGARVCQFTVPDKRKRTYVITPLLGTRLVQGGVACSYLEAGWRCFRLSPEPWRRDEE